MSKEAEIRFPFADTTEGAFRNLTGAHELLRERGIAKPRDMSEVDTIVLHQTATRLGNEPGEYYRIAAHVAVNSAGEVFYVNDLSFFIYHAHAYSRNSISLTVDGNFAGIEGETQITGAGALGKTHELTGEQVTGAQQAILWIVGECAKLGANITDIVAHRQSSNQKQTDPGSALWRSVAIWAQRELGLVNRFYEVLGSGYPIPRQWDIRSLFGWGGDIDKVGIAIIQAVAKKKLALDLSVDGIVGKQTRVAVYVLNEYFGFEGDRIISNNTIEKVASTPEFIEVTDWVAEQVEELGLPVSLLRGDELIDIFARYEG